MKKRIVSLIMALALCLSLLPMAALAEENGPEESLPQEEPLPEEPEEPEETEEPTEPAEPTPEGESAQPARLAGWSADPANTEHSHPICGKTCGHGGSSKHDDVTFAKKIWVEGNTLKIGDTPWNDSGAENYSLGAGSYYLDSDITVSGTIVITDDVNLCLNGNTITSTVNNDPVIKVGDTNINVTLTLCNCKDNGKVTHNVETSGERAGSGVFVNSGSTFNMYGGTVTGNNVTTGGGVYMNGSTFNMYGGTVTGNNATTNGGGVYVTGSSASFTMYGGTISNNKATSSGGGVYMNNGTFIMKDGTITGNSAATNTSSRGGGVYVYGGTFTMEKGSITGNSAIGGGGVYVDGYGTLEMSGGSITGNNAASNGGGVWMQHKFTVSGNVQIKDNVKNGQLNNETGMYTGNDKNNVYLIGGDTPAVITIDADGLADGAKIGVTPGREANTIIVTSGWKEKMGDKTPGNYFTHDGGRYGVDLNDAGEVVLTAHQHNWTYALKEGTENTITATCVNCPEHNNADFKGGTYTITAPEATEGVIRTYNGTAKPATKEFKPASGVTGLDDIGAITYKVKSGDTWTDLGTGKTPTNAGTYTASITVGEVTASVEYGIAKAEQNITVPNNESITKNGVPVDISGWASVTGVAGGTPAGNLTYALEGTYGGVSLTDNKLKATSSASEGTVTIKVTAAATDNYNIKTAAFPVTVVNKTAATVTIEGMPQDKVTYGDSFTLQASQTGDCGPDGTWSWDFDTTYFKAEGNPNPRAITLRVIKAGTPSKGITATYSSDTHQGSASVTVSVVQKAQVTIEAISQHIYVNETAPDLSHPEQGIHYTITGDTIEGITMRYQKDGVDVTPDVKKEGTYDIVITVPVPDDSNYAIECINGTLTISRRSSGTVIIITPSQQPTDNTTNPNTGAAAGSIGYAVCVLAAAGALCAAKKLTKKDEK